MQLAYFSAARHAGVPSSPLSRGRLSKDPSPGPGPLIIIDSFNTENPNQQIILKTCTVGFLGILSVIKYLSSSGGPP